MCYPTIILGKVTLSSHMSKPRGFLNTSLFVKGNNTRMEQSYDTMTLNAQWVRLYNAGWIEDCMWYFTIIRLDYILWTNAEVY